MNRIPGILDEILLEPLLWTRVFLPRGESELLQATPENETPIGEEDHSDHWI